MKWKIGNVEIDNQVVLAPMAGICDSAFRTIVKSMGCGLIETEMVSNKAIMNDNERTKYHNRFLAAKWNHLELPPNISTIICIRTSST